MSGSFRAARAGGIRTAAVKAGQGGGEVERLPAGLKLVNDKPGHYCIAPTTNMPVGKYKGLLEELGLKATRVIKKQGKLAL